MTKVWCREDLD
uniref:Uncharacterized protein n=1 Tax=Anguilla anguilla TaxID=7936 RepID=A0A0E9RDK6_ANGAN